VTTGGGDGCRDDEDGMIWYIYIYILLFQCNVNEQ
jgi:hypothetical protein